MTTLASRVEGAIGRITRSYEARGRLEKLTNYNPATVGSGSIVNEVEYAYNGLGQMTQEFQSHSGAVGGSTPKVQYAYSDGSANHARRTSITLPQTTPSSLVKVLEERTGTSTSAERWFVWGVRSIDDLVRRERDSEPLYVLGDALNVTAVINASGIVRERYGYSGFGTVRYMNASFGSIGNSGKNWDTLFGAYRYDTESGLYQVRCRFLHPALGRWISRDPLFDGSFNATSQYHKIISIRSMTGQRMKRGEPAVAAWDQVAKAAVAAWVIISI